MTVAELLAQLALYEPDTPVVLADDILGQYEKIVTVTYDSESYYEAHSGEAVIVLGLE